jgi:hypothetical protein
MPLACVMSFMTDGYQERPISFSLLAVLPFMCMDVFGTNIPVVSTRGCRNRERIFGVQSLARIWNATHDKKVNCAP